MCKEDVQDVQAEVAIMNLVAGHANVVSLKVGAMHAICSCRNQPSRGTACCMCGMLQAAWGP